MTLEFRSDTGRSYLYDDVTGSIFLWGDLQERLLRLLLAGDYERQRAGLIAAYGERNVEAAARFLQFWRREYGAFARSWDDQKWVACPPAVQLERLVGQKSFELLLILTENCNLRCRYCALSELYPLNRTRSEQRMSIETAKRAVDWYVQLVQPQLGRNPRKRFGLSLYGGEPTMNRPVLEAILDYCRHAYPGLFVPVMTSNGTLLAPDLVRLLVEHDVTLAVSIDGPQEEHDRLRVDAGNRGTFKRIMRNLTWIRENYPEYWATNVRSLSVYDWGTNVEEVERFFAAQEDRLPPSIFVNQINSHNTDWYDRYSTEERDRLLRSRDRIRQRFKEAKVKGEEVSSYMAALVGFNITMAQIRPRAYDTRPDFIPFSGTCMPGEKVAVHPDGHIDMCERVNGTYPIGHLADGGIDYSRLQHMIERYREQVLYDCPGCPVTKHCDICFYRVEDDQDFRRIDSYCEAIVQGARQRLSDYVSILEMNPDADFDFETDTARLEERLFFIR